MKDDCVRVCMVSRASLQPASAAVGLHQQHHWVALEARFLFALLEGLMAFGTSVFLRRSGHLPLHLLLKSLLQG